VKAHGALALLDTMRVGKQRFRFSSQSPLHVWYTICTIRKANYFYKYVRVARGFANKKDQGMMCVLP
jgi:hypothetical protein